MFPNLAQLRINDRKLSTADIINTNNIDNIDNTDNTDDTNDTDNESKTYFWNKSANETDSDIKKKETVIMKMI